MRISDWSSDVCSSDLADLVLQGEKAAGVVGRQDQVVGVRLAAAVGREDADVADAGVGHAAQGFQEGAGLYAGGHHGATSVAGAGGAAGLVGLRVRHLAKNLLPCGGAKAGSVLAAPRAALGRQSLA